jgi:hypothetical protein
MTSDRWTARRLDLLAGAAVVSLVALTYANACHGELFFDNHYILSDHRLRDPAELPSIWLKDYWYGLTPSRLWRPLTTFTYFLNYTVLGSGQSAFGYHAVNILLHAGCALLVLALLRRLGLARPFALLGAAVFACHPIATEAVTNIVGRADLLATLFTIGALLIVRRSLLAAALLYAMGLLSKESAVVTPALLIVLGACVPRFLGEHGSVAARARRLLRPTVAFALTLAVYLAIRSWVLSGAAETLTREANFLVGLPWLTQKLTAIKVIGLQVALLIFPVDSLGRLGLRPGARRDQRRRSAALARRARARGRARARCARPAPSAEPVRRRRSLVRGRADTDQQSAVPDRHRDGRAAPLSAERGGRARARGGRRGARARLARAGGAHRARDRGGADRRIALRPRVRAQRGLERRPHVLAVYGLGVAAVCARAAHVRALASQGGLARVRRTRRAARARGRDRSGGHREPRVAGVRARGALAARACAGADRRMRSAIGRRPPSKVRAASALEERVPHGPSSHLARARATLAITDAVAGGGQADLLAQAHASYRRAISLDPTNVAFQRELAGFLLTSPGNGTRR